MATIHRLLIFSQFLLFIRHSECFLVLKTSPKLRRSSSINQKARQLPSPSSARLTHPVTSISYSSDDFFDFFSDTGPQIPSANLLTRARQQRRVRKSIEDIRTTVEEASPGGPFPYSIASPPNSQFDFDFDEVHTEVNEDIKFIVRDYSSAVEREIEGKMKEEAKARRSEGEQIAMAQHTAQSPMSRITPKQEVELATTVQKGVKVFKVKKELETDLCREATNAEWSKAAGLSKAELRRTVSNYREAKAALTQANLGLVHAVIRANKTLKSASRSHEELFQEGSLGLLRAAELFDPTKGLRFSTYATIWIKGVLSNNGSGSSLITVPQREKTKWNKIRRAANAVLEETGFEPGTEELSTLTGLGVEEIEQVTDSVLRARRTVSLDYRYTSQQAKGDQNPFSVIQGDKSMQAQSTAETLQLQADVVATMASNLDSRERRLLRLRYGLVDGKSRSLADCAEQMGLSKERVRKLNIACLEKLRLAKESSNLEEYLLTIL